MQLLTTTSKKFFSTGNTARKQICPTIQTSAPFLQHLQETKMAKQQSQMLLLHRQHTTTQKFRALQSFWQAATIKPLNLQKTGHARYNSRMCSTQTLETAKDAST